MRRPSTGVVSLWVDSIEQREPFERVLGAATVRLAGYSVVESLYRDYGGNQWAAPRSWPDGERSPGVLTVALRSNPCRARSARIGWSTSSLSASLTTGN